MKSNWAASTLVNNAGIMVIGRMLETPLDAQPSNSTSTCAEDRLPCRRTSDVPWWADHQHRLARRQDPNTRLGRLQRHQGRPGPERSLDAELAPGARVRRTPAFTNTRLIDGTTTPRLTSAIAPEQVADAVVGLIEKYKPIATCARQLSASAVSSMPARCLRRWMGGQGSA
ncbi:MAG: hypothetical protein R2709_10745 [Marmoricola sp.]